MLPVLKVGKTFRFAFMQGGKDPDDLIREKGIGAFKAVLSGSQPVWDVLWQREVNETVDVRTPDAQAKLEQKLYAIIRTIADPAVHTAYFRTCRMQLADLFWQVARSHRNLPERGFDNRDIKIQQDGVQKVLLGLLVHYPDFIEEKSEHISALHFSPQLEELAPGSSIAC